MKQLFLGVAALISMTVFSQKDELKVLKKIYNKDVISSEDLKNYKEASDKLNTIASSESDKEVKIKENSVMHIKFTEPIPDRTSENPFENFDFGKKMNRCGVQSLNEAFPDQPFLRLRQSD